MAEIHPLRGWRYDLGQVGDLSDVTAPPYDVIDRKMQDELYQKHPCNVVRVDLNREEPGDESFDDRYARAAKFLQHWKQDGVLMQEGEDALYVYHQEFTWEGQHYVRKGFLGRLRLEEFGQGQVFPHEETMSGPKADRLKLTQASRMNLSAIFGLYPDSDNAAQNALEDVIVGQTPIEARDHNSVIHRIWPVTDPNAVGRVRELLRDRPIFIADGHHRYETAVNYRNRLREQGLLHDDRHPANFVLMMFVGMADPGLAILPTHRLLSGLPPVTADELREIVGGHIALEEVKSGPDGARDAWELVAADGGQNVFGFGTSDGRWLFGRVTDAGPMDDIAADHSPEWRELGVSLLHRMVVDHLLKPRYPDAEVGCRYVHLLEEVVEAQQGQECQLAVLVPPAQIGHVEAIASKFEKMPPKSTFFYPKLLTGLVFSALE